MRVGPAYLPATTLQGEPLVWPGRGRTCTTMDEIGPIGKADVDGEIILVEIRSLFKAGEVTIEMLLECLQNLKEETQRTIVLHDVMN